MDKSNICAVRRLSILGTGHAVPAAAVTSEQLDVQMGFARGRIYKASGVYKRHVAGAEETSASLGAMAAIRALKAANLTLSDIDCLVSANATMDQGMPYNAALLNSELGFADGAVPAFDIGASCLSFLTAIDTLSWALAGGNYKRILVVSSDIASLGLDWSILEGSAIFGDGAAAAVIGLPEGDTAGRILGSDMRTLAAGAHYCQIKGGGSRFHPSRINGEIDPYFKFSMDGKNVFRLAVKHVPDFIDNLLGKANLKHKDIDWLVPHQASQLALNHMAKRIGFDDERMIDIFADHGNQVAASMPTALDIAIRDGRIQRGHKLLLLGTGAGLSLGGMILEY